MFLAKKRFYECKKKIKNAKKYFFVRIHLRSHSQKARFVRMVSRYYFYFIIMNTTISTAGKILLVSVLLSGAIVLASSLASTETENGKEKQFGVMGNRSGEMHTVMSSLTDEQRDAVKDLRHSGAEKSEIIELIESYGVEIPESIKEKNAQHEAVKSALDAQDYDAFTLAVEGTPLESKITEENFDDFLALHQAKESGDMETAKQLAQDLDLPRKGKRGNRERGKEGCKKDFLQE